jgi:alkylation response protein AidB-like acyl-CoA dehydrogenase
MGAYAARLIGKFFMLDPSALEETLSVLATNAATADGEPIWPAASWGALRRAGVLGWSIPSVYSGYERGIIESLEGYAQLGSACLTTAFILSQREAAVRRIIDHGSPELCRELLRPLACGGHFATVGLSQLTTSHQHTQPALVARLTNTSLVLDGTIPWVTGAAEAEHIIIGAVLDDGRQVLAVLPRELKGVSVGPPLDLMALAGSLTAEITCRNVVLDRRWLLAGPADRVMAGGRGGTGGLETSCLALGLAAAAIHYLQDQAKMRPELQFTTDRLEQARRTLWEELSNLASAGSTPEKAASLRARANALVLRATQVALTAAKGAGFLRNHLAQRWARQALFFLVWSCPRPAAEATLALLAPGDVCS